MKRERRYLILCGLAALSWQACATPTPHALRQPSKTEVVRLRYQLAGTLIARHDYDSAAPLVRDLLVKFPNDARLRTYLAIVLREKGVYAAADRELKVAHRLRPDDPQIYTQWGMLEMRQRHYEKAEKYHRKALALSPKNAAYLNDLGFCLLTQRKLDEARKTLEAALRSDPSFRTAYNNLGIVWGLLDNKEAALRAFQAAGSQAMALTNMGYVAELKGQPMLARRYYERALRTRRGYAPAENNLRLIDPHNALTRLPRSDEDLVPIEQSRAVEHKYSDRPDVGPQRMEHRALNGSKDGPQRNRLDPLKRLKEKQDGTVRHN